jgi:endoglucanase
MPRLRLLRLLAAVLIALPATTAVTVAGSPTCPIAASDPLARGFSLTGWFDETPSRPPDLDLLARLRRRGLGHLRLPVRAETVSPRFTDAARLARRHRDLAAALDRLIGLDYVVVVDLHGGDRLAELFRRDRRAGADAVIEAWRGLAPILAGRPPGRLFVEILNEPPLPDEAWRPLQEAILAALAPTLATIDPILSTGGPQRVERLAESTPTGPSTAIWAVHYYDPMVFTHQGAEWIRPDPIADLADVPFPLAGDDPRIAGLIERAIAGGHPATADYLRSLASARFGLAEIERDIDRLGAWSRATGRRVVIGEFGVLRTAPPADRRDWLAAVVAAAERNCLGWTHWEYRDGFGFVDPSTGRPDEAILSALLPAAR